MFFLLFWFLPRISRSLFRISWCGLLDHTVYCRSQCPQTWVVMLTIQVQRGSFLCVAGTKDEEKFFFISERISVPCAVRAEAEETVEHSACNATEHKQLSAHRRVK